jgi:activator of HSP90 ATPase
MSLTLCKIDLVETTSTPSPLPSQTRASGEACSTDITLSCTINAEAKRIFHALIEPEYRELWMRIPDQDENARIIASNSRDLFRLDYYRFGQLDLSIVGCYRICRRRRQVFNWWRNTPTSTSSLVELRLDGSFSSSVLRLKHRGLGTEAEYIWHSQMWRASLTSLALLF